ncbi:hypothetical protein [Pyrobaculum islandicum]|nr:hypothetical protein [Pyrobaculum islandicum]
MVGVIIEPSTSRTVNTTLAISGPADIPASTYPVSATYYIYPYIGSSSLLVPGGSVNYWLYFSGTSQLVASGSVVVPWHKPAVLTLELYPGTYDLVVQYAGYIDGPITYQPSAQVKIQISVYPTG